MNRTPLPLRRWLAAVAGLAVGLGGALALATSPAHAQDAGPEAPPEPDVWCQFTLEVELYDEQRDSDPRPWRVVVDSDHVLWQSGDWSDDAALAQASPDELEANGWTTSPPFSAPLDLEGMPEGWIDVEYWSVASEDWHHYDRDSWWNGYDQPCTWTGEIEVTYPTCDDPTASVTIPGKQEDDPHGPVTYLINGAVVEPGTHPLEPGEYEIVGIRKGGVKTYGKKWLDITIEPVDCTTPEPTPTPTTTPEPTPTTTPTTTPVPEDGGEGGGDEELPVTGFQAGAAAVGALLLLGLGAGLFLVARRRRITFTA